MTRRVEFHIVITADSETTEDDDTTREYVQGLVNMTNGHTIYDAHVELTQWTGTNGLKSWDPDTKTLR